MAASMPKCKKDSNLRRSWWSAELERSKKTLVNFMRRYDYKGVDRKEYRMRRNKHLYLIRKAKMNAWKNVCGSANSDVRGLFYKWAKGGPVRCRVPTSIRTREGSYTETAISTAECLFNELFPKDEGNSNLNVNRIGRIEQLPTEEEVEKAIWSMSQRKASGLDFVTIFRRWWSL